MYININRHLEDDIVTCISLHSHWIAWNIKQAFLPFDLCFMVLLFWISWLVVIFCVGLICFPSLMCNCFVCCGGGGCCVVVSRFMEYSHLYPTVSKDTALCAGVRPCVARRCHGERGLVSWDSYPAASSTSATTFPSATFHFLWL